MKPSSIIFLSVGLFMIISGLLICNTAKSQAAEANFNLFEAGYDKNGNTIKSFEFDTDEKPVKKIAIDIDGVDVEVIGGQISSRVDVYNMYPITYTCSVSSQVMTVSNHFDVSLLIDSGGSGLGFNGIRKYLDKNMLRKRDMKVVIYISDSDDLAQIEFNVANCNVNLSGISGDVDLVFGHQSSEEKNDIPCSNCTISANSINTTRDFVIYTENCSFNLSNTLFGNVTATISDTEFNFTPSYLSGVIGYSVTTGIRGEVWVNGTLQGTGSYSADYFSSYPNVTVYQIGGKTNITTH